MMYRFWKYVSVVMLHLVIAAQGVRLTIEGGTVGTLNKEVKEDTNVVLDCSFTPTTVGSQQQSYLEWTYSKVYGATDAKNIIHNGQVIYQPPQQPNHFALKTPSSLEINKIKRTESGFYTCIATIPTDTPSKARGTYNLTVLVPPSKPSCQFPSDHAITLGFSTEFRCYSAEGVPAPQYTWYKDNLPLPEGGGQKDSRYSNTSYTYSKQTGTLTFSKVVAGDKGIYYCKAENSQGSEQCTAVKIVTKSQDVGAIIGIVFGVIFGVLLIGILVWWTWRKGYCDNFGRSSEPDEPEDEDANDIMLDGTGPSVHKPPSVANGSTGKQDPSMMI